MLRDRQIVLPNIARAGHGVNFRFPPVACPLRVGHQVDGGSLAKILRCRRETKWRRVRIERGIATALNTRGVATARGGRWCRFGLHRGGFGVT